MYNDFYGEPMMHHKHDHMGPIEFAQVSNAGAYARLHSRLTSHIEDDIRHITAEERDKWNKKADKIEVEDLALKLLKKANKSDIPTLVSELKNDVPYLTKADLNNIINNYGNGGPSWTELNQWILGKLDGYATIDWVEERLRNLTPKEYDLSLYALKSEIPSLAGYATESWVLEQIRNINPGGGSGSGSGGGSSTVTTYSAGEGININGTTISLRTATTNSLGGFVASPNSDSSDDSAGKNYYVRIHPNSRRGYVHVPWTSSNTPGGDGHTKYYEQAFRVTDTLTPPAVPSAPIDDNDNDPYAWKHYAQNSDGTAYVWMCTRLIIDSDAENWRGPWLISGPKGEAGADGGDIEFVYYVGVSDDVSDVPTLNNNYGTIGATYRLWGDEEIATTDDFIPYEWSDTAQGISENMPYEWVGIRTKENGRWGPFTGPILWSRWGQNGMDGDGVEYIFYASQGPTVFTPGAINYPPSWTNDSGFQTEHEYVRDNSGWTDDPVDLASIGQGAYQYVSIRKKHYDDNAGEMLWGAYSEPALWSYIPTDGIASGFILNLDPDMFLYQVDDNGDAVTETTYTTNVSLYENGTVQTLKKANISGNGFPVTVGDPRLGTSVLGSNQITAVADNVNGTSIPVRITIKRLTGVAGSTVFIPITVTYTDGNDNTGTITATAQINFYRAANGQDGKGISLCANASSIRFNYYKNIVVPEGLEVWALVGDNKISPEDLNNEWTFKYAFLTSNGQTSNKYPLYLNRAFTSATDYNPNNNQAIVIYLYRNGEEYLHELLPYVFDGAPGIGTPTFSIQPLCNSLTLSDGQLSGTLSVLVTNIRMESGENGNPVYKTRYLYPSGNGLRYYDEDGNVDSSLPSFSGTVNITISHIANSSSGLSYSTSPQTFNGNTYNNAFTVTANGVGIPDNNPYYATVQLRSTTQQVFASAVFPFIIPGKNGSSFSQGVGGVIMRVFDFDATIPYSDGTTPSNDGIRYLDVVRYPGATGNGVGSYTGGGYFRLKPRETDNFINGDYPNGWPVPLPNGVLNENGPWIAFSNYVDSAAFQAVIAEYLYATNITAKHVLVTDDNNKLVAGITSGIAAYNAEAPVDKRYELDQNGDMAGNNRGNIRFFAGDAYDDGGQTAANLALCPFYVTDKGFLHATNAEIEGHINATSGTFKNGTIDNVTITNATVSGELNYNSLIGNVAEITSSNQTIRSDAYFTKVNIPVPSETAPKYYVTLPKGVKDGTSIYVYCVNPYVTIRPAIGESAIVGSYLRDSSLDYYDPESSASSRGYRWGLSEINSSYTPYQPLEYNLIEGTHQFIRMGGKWYEATMFNYKTSLR